MNLLARNKKGFKQQYAAYQQAIEEYLNGIFTADKPYGRLQEPCVTAFWAAASASGRC